jgi:putative ABC transport system permease protein
MADIKQITRFRFSLWLIALIGVIVPRRLRADWRQEWEAELRYRERMLAEWDRLDRRNKLELLRRSASAFWDALVLQPERWEDEMIQDLRFGVRMLLKNPGFTAVAVLTLALGIGANTAIFSAVNAVLLRSLPYQEAERLVVLWEKSQDNEREIIDAGNWFDWKEQNQVFADIAVFGEGPLPLDWNGEPQEVVVQRMSANLFSVLGVSPMLGRAFAPDESEAGRNLVVMISYDCWQRRFGGDAQVIGRKVNIAGIENTIIGVMQPGFKWSIKKNSGPDLAAEFWWPYPITEQWRQRRGRFLCAVARLKPGVSAEQAQVEMDVIGARLERDYPESNRGYGVSVVPLRSQLAGELRPALLMLMGAVGFVLLIACATVANLLLARAAVRQKEIAVRAALGASRVRVWRQLLTESALLACLGGAAGLMLAAWGVRLLARLSPPELGAWQNIKLDLPTLGFTFVVALLTGLIFGLAPAYTSSRLNLAGALKETGGNSSAGRRQFFHRLFVTAEIALAFVLLVGAGLLLKSFWRLQSVDTGFNARNVLTLRVPLPPRALGRSSGQDGRYTSFFNNLTAMLKSLPGVESVGAISDPPFAGMQTPQGFSVEGRPKNPAAQRNETRLYVADENYFHAMQIRLKSGRLFTPQEVAEPQHVMLINEAFARKYFPDEDPTRRRIVINLRPPLAPARIIGVVADVKQLQLDHEVKPAVYLPIADRPFSRMTIVLRTKGDALALASAAKEAIKSRYSKQPVEDVRTLESMQAASIARHRFNAILLLAFACVAVLLSALGIYGVMAYAVAQRKHEIGVRLALGARPRDILSLVVRQGMRLAFAGVAFGVALGLGLTRALRHLLFNVSATDPATFTLITVLLIGVAFIAIYIPARRATNVDPLTALRHA